MCCAMLSSKMQIEIKFAKLKSHIQLYESVWLGQAMSWQIIEEFDLLW